MVVSTDVELHWVVTSIQEPVAVSITFELHQAWNLSLKKSDYDHPSEYWVLNPFIESVLIWQYHILSIEIGLT